MTSHQSPSYVTKPIVVNGLVMSLLDNMDQDEYTPPGPPSEGVLATNVYEYAQCCPSPSWSSSFLFRHLRAVEVF